MSFIVFFSIPNIFRFHESNFDKFAQYGPVVREEVMWNFPLIHLFDASDIEKILKFKSEAPVRPYNEADVYYRQYRKDLYDNIGMVNENGEEWLRLRKLLTPPLTNRHGFKLEVNKNNFWS